MCGICGFTGASAEDLAILEAMCDIIAHRGPDGEGRYLHDGIALGHRRLSLIDLENGNQPMVRHDGELESAICSPATDSHGNPCSMYADTSGDYAIVYNGEIYNYRELMQELAAEGWTLRTQSDTEVLLVGYIAWGPKILDKVRGMFAFAIWDRPKRELFCARDFFGIKPFYYTQQGGRFIFASEIKSILEHPDYTRTFNNEALAAYLCFQFSALPETFFKGIFKLPPAHYLIVREDGTLNMERYWQADYQPEAKRSLEDTAAQIDACMHESVRFHNVADVEVGSFLSSGIDSSYMAACLLQENPRIHTFTVGFEEYSGERDEVSWARELAREMDMDNSYKHITEAEYWEVLPRVQWHMDEPSADPSAVALYFVDQLAATAVKAVMSGEGADEFFGGYRVYNTPLANKKLSWAPKGLLKAGAKALGAAHIRGANYLDRASKSVEDWYYTNANGVAFSVEERAELMKDGAAGYPLPQEIVAPVYEEARAKGLDSVGAMQYVDLHFWLVGDILLKTDKMSMAHSLESRVPFMDREVFALSTTVPTEQKVDGTQTKIALRQASLHDIPNDWAQKEKLGFPVPVSNWLREDKYYALIKDTFESATAKRFFHTEKLVELLDEHKAGTKDNTRKIWIVYMFLMWYGIYFGEEMSQ